MYVCLCLYVYEGACVCEYASCMFVWECVCVREIVCVRVENQMNLFDNQYIDSVQTSYEYMDYLNAKFEPKI